MSQNVLRRQNNPWSSGRSMINQNINVEKTINILCITIYLPLLFQSTQHPTTKIIPYTLKLSPCMQKMIDQTDSVLQLIFPRHPHTSPSSLILLLFPVLILVYLPVWPISYFIQKDNLGGSLTLQVIFISVLHTCLLKSGSKLKWEKLLVSEGGWNVVVNSCNLGEEHYKYNEEYYKDYKDFYHQPSIWCYWLEVF